MANNHSKGNIPVACKPATWGTIIEVRLKDVKPLQRRGKWQELADDLLLRLEKTPLPSALEVPFEDYRTAKTASDSLVRYFKQARGIHAVRITMHGAKLYVYRGENWNKYEGKAYED